VTDKTPGPARTTRQRVELLSVLADCNEFMTPREIHEQLRSRGAPVGLTTVYRTLQTLVEEGEVDLMRMPNGEQLYRRCGTAHHHHLTCRGCSTTVEVMSPTVERWAATTSSDHGFTHVSHTLEIFGVCSRCARSD
jgi:Fur family transcriptional regulator, ferric uptake regulator